MHKQYPCINVIASLHIYCLKLYVNAFNVLNQQTLLTWIKVKVTWFLFDGDMRWRHRRKGCICVTMVTLSCDVIERPVM